MKFYNNKSGATGAVARRIAESAVLVAAMTVGHASSAQSAGTTEPKPAANVTQAVPPTTLASATAARTSLSRKRAAKSSLKAYAPVKVFDDTTDVPEIEMFVGESRVLPSPGVGRVAVGNGKIMTAAVLDNKEILLFANERGTSSLFIWNADGRYQRLKINVVAGDTSRVAREMAAFVSKVPGAKVSVIGQNVIVEGDRLSTQDLDKIKKLQQVYPQLLNFTHPDGWEKMVMIDVKVVEFPKNYLRELGLRWVPTGGGAVGAIWMPGRRGHDGPYVLNIPENGGLPISGPDGQAPVLPRGLNAAAAINLGFDVSLDALVQDGQATLLAEPQLSTSSGKEATFDAGGEYPYAVVTSEGPSITFKQYGVLLKIKPVVDRDGFIRSEIRSEVSGIDMAVSTPFGPALRTRKTETHFNVKSGQTIVLSGMLSAEKSWSVDKLPLLGDIPVLGALFRSKRFINNETELVVFVTPRLTEPTDDRQINRISEVDERLKEQLDDVQLIEPLSRPPELGDGSNPPQASSIDHDVGAVPAPTDAAVVKPSEAPSGRGAGATSQVVDDEGSALRVLQDGVVLRAQPHGRAQSMSVLSLGQVVRLAKAGPKSNGSVYWRQVAVGDLLGWVPSKDVEPVGRELGTVRNEGIEGQLPRAIDAQVSEAKTKVVQRGEAPVAGSSSIRKFRVTLSRLALRVAPDVNALVITQISQDTIVESRGALHEQRVGVWQSVIADGKEGWVDVRWLEPVEG